MIVEGQGMACAQRHLKPTFRHRIGQQGQHPAATIGGQEAVAVGIGRQAADIGRHQTGAESAGLNLEHLDAATDR